MTDISIRKTGRVGRITLTRPQALNALTPAMGRAVEAALDAWRDDTAVTMIVIDAAGDRAFCSGGDIALIYAAGRAGDFSVARNFWRDEYRMNAKLFHFPKPVAVFMQGFTMGGGVGIGCHGSHRVVCENSQIAMPECGIGLVPDVGGTLILGRAPGRCGEYLGSTARRMGPGDAIYAGFADYYVPRAAWPGLVAALEEGGDWAAIDRAAILAPNGDLPGLQDQIDRHFGGETLIDIVTSLNHNGGEFSASALAALARVSPLSASIAVELVHRARALGTIEAALDAEFRATYRAIERGDFLEGIRAQIVDKDRKPVWKFADAESVPAGEVPAMLMPLGPEALILGDFR